MTLFLEERGWVVDLAERKHSPQANPCVSHGSTEERKSARRAALRMTFEGDGDCQGPVGEDELPGVQHYFLGDDATRWRTDVPLYSSVLYREMYPGIDVRMRRDDDHPEYDLLITPGADLARACVRVDGSRGLRIENDGSLVIDTALGTLTQPVPRTWETASTGQRREVACRYVLRSGERFGFEVEGWDGASPLTIDPGLLWSTFVGGRTLDRASAVHVDEIGRATIGGKTTSTRFPTSVGAYSTTVTPGLWLQDAYVTVLDPDLTGTSQLVYSTFIGGNRDEEVADISVDAQGVVTFVGHTGSADFPTTPGAFGRTLAPRASAGFVCRIDPRLPGRAQLIYSTLVADILDALSVDASGVLTIAGYTLGLGFAATPGAYDTTFNGASDAIVARVDPSRAGAAQLLYATFLGGPGNDYGRDLYVEASGIVTTVGIASFGFPTTPNAFRAPFTFSDVFVSRLDPRQPAARQLIYSTALGGTLFGAQAVHVDSSGILTVAGDANVNAFPTTPGALSRTRSGSRDAFVTRLDPRRSGSAQLRYSTFLGGRGQSSATDLFVEPNGWITLTGHTWGFGFPTTRGALDETHNGGGLCGNDDAFVSRLDPGRVGSEQLIYSTFLGGSEIDFAAALSVDGHGFVTVAGHTMSAGFPTLHAYDSTYNGGTEACPNGDAFVTRLDMLPTGVSAYGSSSSGCHGTLPITVSSSPHLRNTEFSIACGNAPANAAGLLVLGVAPLASALSVAGVGLWVDLAAGPFVLRSVVSNAAGAADVRVPIPGRPSLAGRSLYAQVLWAGPAAPPPCPASGTSATAALRITIQP